MEETKKPFKIGKSLNKVLIIEMYLRNVFEPFFGWDYVKELLKEEIKKGSKSYKIAVNELTKEGIRITPFVEEITIDFLESLKLNLAMTIGRLEGKDYLIYEPRNEKNKKRINKGKNK